MSRSRSCADCVNFESRVDDFGVPGCKSFGYLLDVKSYTPSSQALTAFAEGCQNFNVATETAVKINRVGSPQPMKVAEVYGATDKTQPMDCRECAYFIQPAAVRTTSGFAAGMCGAKAELIPVLEVRATAQSCSIGNIGENRSNRVDDFVVVDVRLSGQRRKRTTAPVVEAEPAHHLKYDPREWPTDAPVTPEDTNAGIKAWRKVVDPTGYGKPVLMPIFDWKALGIEEDPRLSYGDHRPNLYVDHAGLLYTWAFTNLGGITESAALNRTLALIGDAGTGKTEFFCYLAYLMDLPFTRISLRPDTDSIDFFGTTHLEPVKFPDGKSEVVTRWRPGSFTAAYTKPGVLCLDEPNSAPDAVWFLLRPVLDNAGQLRIDSENMRFDKHPYLFIGLAMNPSWKPIYRGARDLSAADMSRLLTFGLEYPDEKIERKIITDHCEDVGYTLPSMVLDKLMSITKELRTMVNEGTLQTSWGIRDVVKVAQLTWGFSLENAFKIGILDALEPDQANTIRTVVTSYA